MIQVIISRKGKLIRKAEILEFEKAILEAQGFTVKEVKVEIQTKEEKQARKTK